MLNPWKGFYEYTKGMYEAISRDHIITKLCNCRYCNTLFSICPHCSKAHIIVDVYETSKTQNCLYCHREFQAAFDGEITWALSIERFGSWIQNKEKRSLISSGFPGFCHFAIALWWERLIPNSGSASSSMRSINAPSAHEWNSGLRYSAYAIASLGIP